MKTIAALALGATAIAITNPADAIQICKPKKGEARVWHCIYNKDDIYKAWSAPGSALMIRLAPDELILKVEAADTDTIVVGHGDNVATLKFAGCAIPEPVFISSVKTTTRESRQYAFQMETHPQVCSKAIPGDEVQPEAQASAAGTQNASYNDGSQRTRIPLAVPTPNIHHLEHPNDLAEGSDIPYMLTMDYPSDEREAREATERKMARVREKQQVENVLAAAAVGKARTTGFLNNHYYGRGDPTMKPCLECGPTDDGNTTRVFFPGGTEIPAFDKLKNANKGCGDEGREAVHDFNAQETSITIHDPDGTPRETAGKMVELPGTAPGWCMRANNSVYQFTNASYNPVGWPTGTGTISPDVKRVVRGSQEDGR